jgi:hypothetical protein
MYVAAGLLTALLCSGPGAEVVTDGFPPARLAGGRFTAELNRPLTASWKGLPLRDVVRRISDEREISILLDRRIDPSQELAIDFAGEPLRDALQIIASKARAEMRVIANVVYLGPEATAAKLRTVIELRGEELNTSETSLSRRQELAGRRTIHWNDLDRPADIVRRVASLYGLEVPGLEQVPHDLWSGATLPDLSAREALSLVLIQFDLTFAWEEGGAAIRIVPLPERLVLERRYRPRGESSAAAAERWRGEFPGLRAELRGNEVAVTATAEQHEAIAESLQPRRSTGRSHAAERPMPIEHRRFTLQMERVPVSALMEKLEESGMIFEYDAAKLAQAGVDLDQAITVRVRDAEPDEFFRAVFEPLGVRHSFKGLRVRLSPHR